MALGLAAIVRTSPYDLAPWLPGALTSLSRLAPGAPPVSTTVSKAFADFKKTHADNWHVCKEQLSQDLLEVISGLTSPAGYYV